MRVIAGKAKGRRLFAPKSKTIRPALDQVKEAVFNILFDVEGFRILDLFAGTGAMGIEALSRGADFAVFVDREKEAVKLIQRNLEACRFEAQSQILPLSVGKALKLLAERGECFDLIFIDPPYEKGFIEKSLQKLENSPLLKPSTRILLEHHPKEPIPEMAGLTLTDQRKYGQTRVSFLRPT